MVRNKLLHVIIHLFIKLTKKSKKILTDCLPILHQSFCAHVKKIQIIINRLVINDRWKLWILWLKYNIKIPKLNHFKSQLEIYKFYKCQL